MSASLVGSEMCIRDSWLGAGLVGGRHLGLGVAVADELLSQLSEGGACLGHSAVMYRRCPGMRFPPLASLGGRQLPPILRCEFVWPAVDGARKILPPLGPLLSVSIDRIKTASRIRKTPHPVGPTDKPRLETFE
eukprot:4842991-Alexandrium_andersonii.AAC.1